jgi:CheY-like chemotaxis protein
MTNLQSTISNPKSKIILLVEDNPDDEVLTLRALKKSNIANEIVVARDGVEALQYLLGPRTDTSGKEKVWPQVVLLDLKLPKIDGLEVLQRMRADAKTRLLPVVILTSSKEEQDLIQGYKQGCNSYIRKPVDFDQFTEAVRQLGLYWLVINEAPPSAV